MHETERHRVILAAAQSHPVVTVAELCEVTGSSEATIRRDIAALDEQGRLRRVRGGAEALNPPAQGGLMGRPFSVNESLNIAQKRSVFPEDIAEAIYFFASEASAKSTGNIINVDAGNAQSFPR